MIAEVENKKMTWRLTAEEGIGKTEKKKKWLGERAPSVSSSEVQGDTSQPAKVAFDCFPLVRLPARSEY